MGVGVFDQLEGLGVLAGNDRQDPVMLQLCRLVVLVPRRSLDLVGGHGDLDLDDEGPEYDLEQWDLVGVERQGLVRVEVLVQRDPREVRQDAELAILVFLVALVARNTSKQSRWILAMNKSWASVFSGASKTGDSPASQ